MEPLRAQVEHHILTLEVENWLAPKKVYHRPNKPRHAPVDHSNDEAKRYQDFNKAQNDLSKEITPGWSRRKILIAGLS